MNGHETQLSTSWQRVNAGATAIQRWWRQVYRQKKEKEKEDMSVRIRALRNTVETIIEDLLMSEEIPLLIQEIILAPYEDIKEFSPRTKGLNNCYEVFLNHTIREMTNELVVQVIDAMVSVHILKLGKSTKSPTTLEAIVDNFFHDIIERMSISVVEDAIQDEVDSYFNKKNVLFEFEEMVEKQVQSVAIEVHSEYRKSSGYRKARMTQLQAKMKRLKELRQEEEGIFAIAGNQREESSMMNVKFQRVPSVIVPMDERAPDKKCA